MSWFNFSALKEYKILLGCLTYYKYYWEKSNILSERLANNDSYSKFDSSTRFAAFSLTVNLIFEQFLKGLVSCILKVPIFDCVKCRTVYTNNISMISFFMTIRQSIRFLLVVLYVGCIAALSLLPMSDFPKVPLFRGADKIVHLMMYLVFSVLFCWAIQSEKNIKRLFPVIFLTTGWGVFMEFLQLEMHVGRSFSSYDILANCLGVFAGILFYSLVSRKYLS